MKVAVDGGQPVPFALGQFDPTGIAVDGAHVYWSDYVARAVIMVAVDGGTPAPIATGLAGPFGVATDGTSVYCANHGDGTIVRIPIDPEAGGPVDVVSSQTTIWTVVVAAGNVFWADWGPYVVDAGYPQGSIMKLPLDGGMVVKLVSPVDQPYNIAVDSKNVYWTQPGAVMSVPVGGGSPTVVARGQTPDSIAVDDTSVYWSDPGVGTIMRLVK
jgi:hypothetical protein